MTVLQDVQWMSATECSPVISSLSSLGPNVTLTLQRARHSGEPELFKQSL